MNSPKRILIVDNDPDVLDSVGYNLKTAGYEVITANNPEEASFHLDSKIIHLAIIDVRLYDENNGGDLSGFEMARKIPEYLPCLIFTAYADKEYIRIALGDVKARDILDKKAPKAGAELIERVKKLFASDVKVNFDLEIEGVFELETVADNIEIPFNDEALKPTVFDVHQVLQTLFHRARGIYIVSLIPPETAPTATQSGSVLLKVLPRFEKAWGAPLVVKFCARYEVEQEAKNYHTIKPFLGGHRLPVLDGEAYSREIGGLAYSLIGAEDWETISTLSEVLLNKETESVINLLERFFGNTFRSLFTDANRRNINLTTVYTEQLRLTPTKLEEAINEFHPEALNETRLRFEGIKNSFRNPIQWAISENKFRNFEILSQWCLCHGDLHSQNILVDADGHFWLIDFARVAESHALRDIVQLETDIKFYLLPVIDLQALLLFERILLAQGNFDDIVIAESFNNAQLDHAYQIILALRHIASQLIDLNGDMREYYEALFLHTLNIMRLRHISLAKKEHALLSAALICHRLEDWPAWSFSPPQTIEKKIPNSQLEKDDPDSENLYQSRQYTLSWQNRLIGTGIFLLTGVGIVIILWIGMVYLNPGWREYVATLGIISLFAIISFALIGLINGQTAVNAMIKIISFPFGKRNKNEESSQAEVPAKDVE